jgi:hypothetical protein
MRMGGRQIISLPRGEHVSRAGSVLNGYYNFFVFISHTSRVVVLKIIITEAKFECRHHTHRQFEETM